MRHSTEMEERSGGGLDAFRELDVRHKLQYIRDYDKVWIFLILAVIFVIGRHTYRQVTKKETLVTVTLVNVKPSDEGKTMLNEGLRRRL